MKEIQTRPYDDDVLQKVVFVQVASSDRAGGETNVDRTFVIAESTLSNPKLIYEKVKFRQPEKLSITQKLNNMSVVPEEQTDEGASAHQSPGGSPCPRPGEHDGRRTGDMAFHSLPPNTTSDPPSYTSQSASLTLTQAANVPIPQATEGSMPLSNGSQKELISEVKKLTEKTEQVLDELQKHGKTHENIEKNTKRTADNTRDMRDGMEEVRQTTSETNDHLKGVNASEEQPEVS